MIAAQYLADGRRSNKYANTLSRSVPISGLVRVGGCILVVAVLALAGCASTTGSKIPTPEQLSDAAYRAFVGGQFSNVLLRYGQPTGQVPYGDLIVHQFQASNIVRYHEPVTSTTTGRIGPAGTNVPYSEKTTASQGYDQTYSCMMRVGVRADGTVHGVDFVGKMAACQVFMP